LQNSQPPFTNPFLEMLTELAPLCAYVCDAPVTFQRTPCSSARAIFSWVVMIFFDAVQFVYTLVTNFALGCGPSPALGLWCAVDVRQRRLGRRRCCKSDCRPSEHSIARHKSDGRGSLANKSFADTGGKYEEPRRRRFWQALRCLCGKPRFPRRRIHWF
jgi:hypothetical protein